MKKQSALNKTPGISAEFTRQIGNSVSKYELDENAVGLRYAHQLHREIGRLHTFYPGERCELDYTKYAVFAYPTAKWRDKGDPPVMVFTGLGIDHVSGVIKGYTITPQPTAISGIRLYRSCALPKKLTLPPRLQHLA